MTGFFTGFMSLTWPNCINEGKCKFQQYDIFNKTTVGKLCVMYLVRSTFSEHRFCDDDIGSLLH